MKKIFSIVLVFCMIASLAACGQKQPSGQSSPDGTPDTVEKTVITGSISHSSAPRIDL